MEKLDGHIRWVGQRVHHEISRIFRHRDISGRDACALWRSDMAMIGRPTGWENTTHATLALPAADTLQGFVIQDDRRTRR
jgi:hypothetical protein